MRLNLLPPDYKIQLTKKRSWWEWRRGMVLLAVVAALCTGGLAAAEYHLQQRAGVMQGQIDALRQGTAASPAEDITKVTTKLNATITSLAQTVAVPRSWADDLTQVTAIIPAGVTVQTLTLTGGGLITLQGTAATRLSFIALDEAVKQSARLTQVTTTSTPSKRDNLPFSYTALLRPTPLP